LTTTGLMTSGLTNQAAGGDPAVVGDILATGEAAASDPDAYADADSWRVEVAARLERYRRRRKPRSPRYPSLLLPFDTPESWSRPAPPAGLAGAGSSGIGTAAVATPPVHDELDPIFPTQEEPRADGATSFAEAGQTQVQSPDRYPGKATEHFTPEPSAPEQSAKVIEFPRSAAIPVFQRSELADPVFDHDRPRIVEVPEILPPPPALGGMLIEPAPQELADRQAGADFPLPSASASIARRALAALVDGVVLGTAMAPFAAILVRVNPSLKPNLNLSLNLVRGPLPMLAGALGVVTLLFWAAYEFLFVVYTGSTPGLRAARLRLAAFDGSPLNRRSRRWRVLASFLSVFSAGLGYFWCFLDQDGLCWHDRITRTQVKPAES
jgi:uncharacterized RDD family membrane protein YckC